jgi:hypothetical protein
MKSIRGSNPNVVSSVLSCVELIVRGFGPSEVTGLEQLGDSKASVQIKGVPAREALLRILNWAGFTYRETGGLLAIVPLEARDSAAAACGSLGMQVVND